MNTLLRVEPNFITAALLGIVLFIAYRRLDRTDPFNRHFFFGCLIILAMLLFEAATCFINGNSSRWLLWTSNLMHVFLFSLPPVLTYYWFLLATTLTQRASIREMKVNRAHLIPVAANGVMALASPFFHWIFFIDGSAIYHRGPLFLLSLAIAYGYLAAGFFVLLRNRRQLLPDEFTFLLLFCLMPMVGGLLQGIFYGPLIMWPCSACALVVMYLYLQERMVQTDGLSGAWTRGSFEHYLVRLLHDGDRGSFGVLYADIDGLKAINDRFGHAEGDVAIQTFSDIVRSALRKGDAFARMGGDEFAILVSADSTEGLQAISDRVDSALAQYNRSSGKGYALECSIGADLLRPGEDMDANGVIRRADRLMYEKKRRHKGKG